MRFYICLILAWTIFRSSFSDTDLQDRPNKIYCLQEEEEDDANNHNWERANSRGSSTTTLTLNCDKIDDGEDSIRQRLSYSRHFSSSWKKLVIKCNEYNVPFEDYDILFQDGDLEALELRNCPSFLMNNSQQDFLQRGGNIGSVKNLTIDASSDIDYRLDIEESGNSGRRNEKLLRLQHLKITRTNLKEIFGEIPCSLISLNVSANRIRSLENLQFCKGEQSLISLDLSYNLINRLSHSYLKNLESLQKLNLSYNQIKTLVGNAFQGLTRLDTLDLSSNHINSIPAEVFRHIPNLQHLDLSRNRLIELIPPILKPLKSLVILNLSHNRIQIPLDLKKLPNLLILDLSYNLFDNVDSRQLNPLKRLQILDLSGNNLNSLKIKGLKDLHSVKASSNQIDFLDADTFDMDLRKLKLLDVSNNSISSIHPQAFLHLESLEDLSLEYNLISEFPSSLLSSLANLKVLNLGKNKLKILPNETFIDPMNLIGMKLDENEINFIAQDAFTKCAKLKILNLSGNKLTELSRSIFNQNKNLEAVRLDANYLTNIVGLFKNLPNLGWLNISDNRIDKFDWFLVPSTNLKWLDLHKNLIQDIGNYFNLQDDFKSLQTLDISLNRITHLRKNTLPKNVQIVSLHDNQINRIDPSSFADLSRLSRVDLYANKLKHLDASSLRVPGGSIAEFYLGGNPWECDCELEWLIGVNNNHRNISSSSSFPLVRDLESIYCVTRSDNIVPLVESKEFLCSYETHCFALCHCCDFDACDCEMTCPDNCNCYHDRTWAVNIVDCQSAGFRVPPNSIPMDATEVYLQGNDFGKLSSHSFIGRKNLQVMFLNNSNIQVLLNNTFSGLRRLKKLHLEDNEIRSLNGNEFLSLVNLRELYLHHNHISHIHNKTFSFLRRIEILTLHGNSLKVFQFEILLHRLHSLTSITLSNNPWNCTDCPWISSTIPWLDLVTDPFQCFSKNSTSNICLTSSLVDKHTPIRMNEEEQENDLSSSHSRKNFLHESNLPIIIIIISILIILIVAFGVVLYYRTEILVLTFEWIGFRPFFFPPTLHQDDYDGRNYDVYIGYCAVDDQWVRQVLAVHLEEEEHYRCLLHQRDFEVNPSSSSLADTVLMGTENCSSMIIVVSKHFLLLEWSRYEVRSAFHSVLRSNGSRKKAIFIILGDVSSRDLDPDLRLYFKTNVVIKWNDKLFWSRLRYRLPEPNPILSSASNDNFYTIPFNNSSAGGSTSSNHYFTLTSRISTSQRIYDENLQLTPKLLERTYKLN